jgi:hypothetical protein
MLVKYSYYITIRITASILHYTCVQQEQIFGSRHLRYPSLNGFNHLPLGFYSITAERAAGIICLANSV